MTNSIQISNNKTLKLTNVLFFDLSSSDNDNIEIDILRMENYIKSKGAVPIGPLIQKSCYNINADGQLEIHVYLMRQANNYIHNVEAPFKMESIVRVRNCIYARFTGPEDKMRLAYDKIHVTAFEENIELADEYYTVYVDQQDGSIVADVFVEKKSDD